LNEGSGSNSTYEGNCSIAASEARLILQAREKKGQTDYGIVCT
jgi:hypothetical protein